jgi:hypothetical protein
VKAESVGSHRESLLKYATQFSEVSRNAKTSNLVGTKLVGLGTGGNLDEPSGDLGT